MTFRPIVVFWKQWNNSCDIIQIFERHLWKISWKTLRPYNEIYLDTVHLWNRKDKNDWISKYLIQTLVTFEVICNVHP